MDKESFGKKYGGGTLEGVGSGFSILTNVNICCKQGNIWWSWMADASQKWRGGKILEFQKL